MAITRTVMTDDDGTGTVGTVLNNAWLQTIYNQIDAADAALGTAAVPTYGTFTPVDISGGALVFSTAIGKWAKYGRIVFFWMQVVYPATANAANAQVGTFPYFSRGPAGGSQGWGVHCLWNIVENGRSVLLINPTTAANLTNANVSGRNLIVSGVYLTD